MSKDMSDEDMCCELVGLMIEQTVEVFEYTDTCQELLYIFLHLTYLAIDFSHIIVLHPYMCVYIRIYLPCAFCSPQDLARHVDALAAAKVEPERTLQSNSQ